MNTQTIHVIKNPDEKTFLEIMAIIHVSHEEGMDSGDEDYIAEKMENKNNIHIVCKENGKIVGYLMATSHNDAYEELMEDDPLLKKDAERMYVNFVGVLPEYRKGRALLKMLDMLFLEARENFGTNKFSLHCRTMNGLSRVIQNFFKGIITVVRHIDTWKYTNDEPYDYIEGQHTLKGPGKCNFIMTEKNYSEETNSLDIYTSLEEAKNEIRRRWNDNELRKKVDEFLGSDIPEPFKAGPRAVLARPIMTPDIEHLGFLKLSKKIELSPISWEFKKDKFFTINEDKLSLAKLNFYKGDNEGKPVISSKKIISFKNCEGTTIDELMTTWGENLVEFHHRILGMSKSDVELFDASCWQASKGKRAGDYYPFFFGIFIRNGVLFENFLTSGSELKFTTDIVIPAFNKVTAEFGLRPLIVELLPRDEACNKYWWCYPKEVEDFIGDL